MAYKCVWVCLLSCNASSSSAGSGSVLDHLVASFPGFPGTSFTHWESLRTSPTHFSIPIPVSHFPGTSFTHWESLGTSPTHFSVSHSRFPFPIPVPIPIQIPIPIPIPIPFPIPCFSSCPDYSAILAFTAVLDAPSTYALPRVRLFISTF